MDLTSLEQKYRIMVQKLLLDKSCRPVSAEEDRRIRLARMSEPPVFLESSLSLSIEKHVAIEEAEEAAENAPYWRRKQYSSCGWAVLCQTS